MTKLIVWFDADPVAVRLAALTYGFIGQGAVDDHGDRVVRMIDVIIAKLHRPGLFDFSDRRFIGTLRDQGATIAATRRRGTSRRPTWCSSSARSVALPCSLPVSKRESTSARWCAARLRNPLAPTAADAEDGQKGDLPTSTTASSFYSEPTEA